MNPEAVWAQKMRVEHLARLALVGEEIAGRYDQEDLREQATFRDELIVCDVETENDREKGESGD